MPERFLSRLERFESIDSTQRVVREWLDRGVPEVCVARADQQSSGRGRQGRAWLAPAGAGLLVSIGFRPVGLAAAYAWRLAAIVALAMIDAAEEAAGLRNATLWLKWPNDIVAESPAREPLKVAGVLGESVGLGAQLEAAVVGIGLNGDWRAADFPPGLASTMTSLRELSGGRPIDHDALLDAFLARLEPRYEALRGGVFDAGGWSTRQLTTGRLVEVELTDRLIGGVASGVNPESGALLVRTNDGQVHSVDSGEVVRCRLR
jgi:BirA family biotin operon repressor/biotin-[acetyl-CoA-carboxylase] ligase